MKKPVGIVDDQHLFTRSLCTLVNTFDNFTTVVDALNGKELLAKLGSMNTLPDIMLIDVNMPVMDGMETAAAVSKTYPLIKLVALSMKDDDLTIIGMLKAGCCAYLVKDIHPDEFEKALKEIDHYGYYNADAANINYRRLMNTAKKEAANQLTNREITFLQLSCSELTYKQIASKMNLSERTIDGYRESVFEKLNVQSRVGMAMEAIRRKIVSV